MPRYIEEFDRSEWDKLEAEYNISSMTKNFSVKQKFSRDYENDKVLLELIEPKKLYFLAKKLTYDFSDLFTFFSDNREASLTIFNNDDERKPLVVPEIPKRYFSKPSFVVEKNTIIAPVLTMDSLWSVLFEGDNAERFKRLQSVCAYIDTHYKDRSSMIILPKDILLENADKTIYRSVYVAFSLTDVEAHTLTKEMVYMKMTTGTVNFHEYLIKNKIKNNEKL